MLGIYPFLIHDEQVRLYGSTREAVQETIRICQDKNVLKDYLEERKQEVVSIMMTLFSQEEVMDAYGEECRREGVDDERRRQSQMEENRILSMLRDKFAPDVIAKYSPFSLERIQELGRANGLL